VNRKHKLASCEKCPLKDEPYALADGPPGGRIVVVSRSPGYHDVRNGKPFSGPSGKVLDHLLQMNGYERKDVLVTNTVLCKTDAPPREAIEACKLRLETEVNASHTIIACGPEAAKALAGVSKIAGNRGFVHKRRNFSGHEQDVIVTANPAIVLHKSESFPDLVRDFKRALNPPPTPTFPEVRFTENVAEAKRWARNIDEYSGLMAMDLESRGLSHDAPIIACGFSGTGERAVTFGERVIRDEEFFRRYLSPLSEKPNVIYLWHNGKFDTKLFRSAGVKARVDEDSFLMSYCLDERPGTHSLEYLLAEHMGWGDYEPASVKKFKREVMAAERDGKDVYAIEYDHEEMYTYNAWDAAGTMQLYRMLEEQMDEDDWKLYRKLLIPASEVFRKIELNGVNYDIEAAADLNEMEVLPKLEELLKDLQTIVNNPEYNPNSTTQNSALIHDGWKISLDNRNIATRPGKERAVDKPVYTEIIEGRYTAATKDIDHITMWASTFKDFKELDKQRSTYIEGLIPKAERNNGRIYTTFNIGGTSSGRLSSEKPNIQNITRPKPGIPNIRSLFHSSDKAVILQADYSQAELRCIAVLSQDPKLLKIYRDGEDLHSRVAERFYGASFTKQNRDTAKNIDFGVAYGQAAESFQEKHGIPREEAAEFIKWWWSEFVGVRVWRDSVHKRALEENILINPFGRKKRIHLITKENKNEVLRESVNWYPQSIAHDFLMLSIILADPKLDDNYARILLDGHDSIVADINNDYIDEAKEVLSECMVEAPKHVGWNNIPFEAEIQTGPSWGEVE
jgi:DNA polymerase-1